MEVGLGPGDIVLDGDPALPPRKGTPQLPPPLFGPFCSGTVANLSNYRYASPDTWVSAVIELTAIFDVHSTRGFATLRNHTAITCRFV